tara:strand:+ start:88 stop:1107 length:1020 start_codon:yes stop_codon:yes gene_type:complete
MKVAVTGGTGFTGGHTLKKLIDAGHEPVVLARNAEKLARVIELHKIHPVKYVLGDVSDPVAVSSLMDGCDAAMHIAAVTGTQIRKIPSLKETNIEGTRTVLEEAARREMDPIIYVSSQSTLHPPPEEKYVANGPLSDEPLGVYAQSKVEGERFARRLQEEGHPVVIVWPSGIIGPRDVGISVAASGIARLFNVPILPLPKTGGILMHDVRDLSEVLTRCVVQNQGPRHFGVFGHFYDWDETKTLLRDVTGRNMRSIQLPDNLFLGLGHLGDLFDLLHLPFPLDHSTAQFMTGLKPGDDLHTRQEFNLEWRPLEESFFDTLQWLVEEGHLRPRKVPSLFS